MSLQNIVNYVLGKRDNTPVTQHITIIDKTRDTLTQNIKTHTFGAGMIAEEQTRDGQYNLYNTRSGQKIASFVNSYYLSEANDATMPVGVRIKLEDNAGLDPEKHRRYYISPTDGKQLSPTYTRPILGFSLDGIGVISTPDLKRQFIDTQMQPLTVEGVDTFISLHRSLGQDNRIYVANTGDTQYILDSKLNNIFDHSFAPDTQISVVYDTHDRYIVVNEQENLSFYTFEGLPVEATHDLQHLYHHDIFSRKTTNLETL